MMMKLQQPLKGLRVLDFSRILAGPWCSMLLGDAGAKVIKVEITGTGDDTRLWGPPFLSSKQEKDERFYNHNKQEHNESGVSTYFLSVNRNKQSLAIDLRNDQGRDIAHRLATEWADVVIENFKVGTMERLRLGYETTLFKSNPSLIYCSITGFGPTGPLCQRPGYDVVLSGMYGFMSITGDENGGPVKAGVAMTDILTGTLAQAGILAALHHRNQHGGIGQRVDTSLMEAQLASLVNVATSALNAPPDQPPPPRRGTAHQSIVPYQTFRCKRPPTPSTNGSADVVVEEYIVVGAGNDEQFRRLCQVLQKPELSNDSRFLTNSNRVSNRKVLIEILEGIFLTKSRDEWVHLLDGQGFPVGPVRTVPEAFLCPQAQHRNMVMELEHPIAGHVALPGMPIQYSSVVNNSAADDERKSGSSNSSKKKEKQEPKHNNAILPPPMLGEHTESILQNILNMDTSAIERLEMEGVVECWRKEPKK